jgi:hypothetical protein
MSEMFVSSFIYGTYFNFSLTVMNNELERTWSLLRQTIAGRTGKNNNKSNTAG